MFLGWYPVGKGRIDRLRPFARTAIKLLLFNGAIIVMYSLLLYVFGLEGLRQEFSEIGAVMMAVLLLMGNVTFFLFDALLPRMALLYAVRFRKRFWK